MSKLGVGKGDATGKGALGRLSAKLFGLGSRAQDIDPHAPKVREGLVGTKRRPENADLSSGHYIEMLEIEAKHWQDHLQSEQEHVVQAWLDHPAILQMYLEKRCIDGEDWPFWLKHYFNGAARRGLDLGCGSGSRGLHLLEIESVSEIVGLDISEGRLAEARRVAEEHGYKATYECVDVNAVVLEPNSFDVIFSCHSFHHFHALEHLMQEIAKALRPGGLFILEEFVGPSIFQWTDQQIGIVNDFLTLLPSEYRSFPVPTGAKPRNRMIKVSQGRPTIEQVQNESPFEAIRSGEILPLFREYFQVVHEKPLGGTIQHLLYDGIIHNFRPGEPEAAAILRSVDRLESSLIRSGALQSDFMLLVGTKQ